MSCYLGIQVETSRNNRATSAVRTYTYIYILLICKDICLSCYLWYTMQPYCATIGHPNVHRFAKDIFKLRPNFCLQNRATGNRSFRYFWACKDILAADINSFKNAFPDPDFVNFLLRWHAHRGFHNERFGERARCAVRVQRPSGRYPQSNARNYFNLIQFSLTIINLLSSRQNVKEGVNGLSVKKAVWTRAPCHNIVLQQYSLFGFTFWYLQFILRICRL